MSISVDENRADRWKDIRRLTDRSSAFATPSFNPSIEVWAFFLFLLIFLEHGINTLLSRFSYWCWWFRM